jgi:hypothetical protein
MKERQRRATGDKLTRYLTDDFNLEIYEKLGKPGGTALNREQQVSSIRDRVHRDYHPSPDHLPDRGLVELFIPSPSMFFDLVYSVYEFVKSNKHDLSQIYRRLKEIEREIFQEAKNYKTRPNQEVGRRQRDAETKYRYTLYALAMLIRHKQEGDSGIGDKKLKASSVIIEQALENRLTEKDSQAKAQIMEEVRFVV